MPFTLNISTSSLLDLATQMESASENLHNDTEKIQRLLAQLDETTSGASITREMIDDAKTDMAHCNQLCQKLNKASHYLRSIDEEITALQSKVAAQIADSLKPSVVS